MVLMASQLPLPPRARLPHLPPHSISWVEVSISISIGLDGMEWTLWAS